MKDSWDLVKEGKYLEACRAAETEATEVSSTTGLYNKVIALINLGQLADAQALARRILSGRQHTSDAHQILFGLCQWLQGRHLEAIISWQNGRDAQYTDAAGGVSVPLLEYYGGVRTGDAELVSAARKQLRKKCRLKSMVNWPGVIAPFILGDIPASEMMAKISRIKALKARESCQAYFYRAIFALEAGVPSDHHKFIRLALRQDRSCLLETEYYLAQWESKAGNEPANGDPKSSRTRK